MCSTGHEGYPSIKGEKGKGVDRKTNVQQEDQIKETLRSSYI